eukprot:COSAG02_NODE_1811_length_10794_cov_9.516784_6_plen_126_part_00
MHENRPDRTVENFFLKNWKSPLKFNSVNAALEKVLETAESRFRIRIRNSLECASLSWALLQFINHVVYDGPKLGRTTSPGTSISSASQTRYKPPPGGLLLFYLAAPLDQPGRAHGNPNQTIFNLR